MISPIKLLVVAILSVIVTEAATVSDAQGLVASGDFEGARKILLELRQQTPGDPAVWNLLGAADAQLGNLDEAEKAFRAKQRELRLSPPDEQKAAA